MMYLVSLTKYQAGFYIYVQSDEGFSLGNALPRGNGHKSVRKEMKMIKFENGKRQYFDRNGKEITEGCKICYAIGRIKKVYRTNDDQLGTDATNPIWIEKGRAVPCEFGIYPLTLEETNEVEVIAE